MRLLNPGETDPQSRFKRPRKSYEFSDHERTVILELAQGLGCKIENMSESDLAKTIERVGNRHAHCTDPENYPPEVVQIYEGMQTVPEFLMFERFNKEFTEPVKDDFKDETDQLLNLSNYNNIMVKAYRCVP